MYLEVSKDLTNFKMDDIMWRYGRESDEEEKEGEFHGDSTVVSLVDDTKFIRRRMVTNRYDFDESGLFELKELFYEEEDHHRFVRELLSICLNLYNLDYLRNLANLKSSNTLDFNIIDHYSFCSPIHTSSDEVSLSPTFTLM